MQEKRLEEVNEVILKQILNYKYNSKLLDKVIFNKHLYNCEEIEIVKDSVLQFVPKFNIVKDQLVDHQNLLISKNIRDDFLINNFQLELIINKFWYKFYGNFFKNEKGIISYWRNQFLDCYKKQFFFKKKIEKNKSKLLENNISEINQDLKSNFILSSSSKSNYFKI